MKSFFKQVLTSFLLGAVFIAGGIVFAAVTIPGTCTTPGNCNELQTTLKSLVLKTTLKLSDADGSNTLSFQAPTNVASNVSWTLPASDGTLNQFLKTNGTGGLSWATPTQTDLTPKGTIVAFGGTTAPSGWLLCDGSQVSRSTYSDLFAAIGTAFGSGNGTTTFHLPDLRGVFLRGLDGTKGQDPDKASRTALNTGGNTGNAVGSYQADQFASHFHNWTASRQMAGTDDNNNTSEFAKGDNGGSDPVSKNTDSKGGNETRGKNVYVNYIIKF